MNIQTSQGAMTANALMSTNASSPTSSPTVDGSAFLKLLMAELQHQDPTQPTDPTQMVSQLATISQVAQTTQMNATLSDMLAASSLSQAEQVIGRTVSSGDGSISGKVVSVTIGSAGIIATLDNGKQLSLRGEIKISA